jgi:hypothetical protein
MPFIHTRPAYRPVIALLVSALAAIAIAVASSPAAAADHSQQRLVVRGDATAVDGPCDADVCLVELTDGRFRGTPVGAGAYSGTIRLRVADIFPNGEGGICAPLRARLVLGAGTPDRLVFAFVGASCQDGAGPPETASFTGLAQFVVKRGTGRYAGAGGTGLASFTEDAAGHHRITLIGRIAR